MDQIKIGNFITQLREEKKLSQESLAKKLGISRQTLSNWENGKVVIEKKQIKKLAQIFKISTMELYKGEKKVRRKINKYVIMSMLLLIIIIACIIVYLLCTRKDDNYSYSFSLRSDNVLIKDGYFIKNNDNINFYLGKIDNNSGMNITNLKLYYYLNDTKYTIYGCSECELSSIYLSDNKNIQLYFNFDELYELLNNMYVILTYEDETYEDIKINLNSNVDGEIQSQKNVNLNLDIDIDEIENKIKKNFKKSDEGYYKTLTLNDDKVKITYLDEIIVMNLNSSKEVITYNVNISYIIYEKYYYGELENSIEFSINEYCNNECVKKEEILDKIEEILNNI